MKFCCSYSHMKSKPIKYYLLLVLIPFLQACPPPVPCDPIITQIEPIPDSVQSIIPYVNGEVYDYIHSEGTIVQFMCSSSLEENRQCFDCNECLVFEKLQVILEPDYLLPPIEMTLRQIDDSFYELVVGYGNSSFTIPVNFNEYNSIAEIFSDTIGIKRDNWSNFYDSKSSLYADSIYYALDKGIVKIVMSNDETFSIDED